MVIRSILLVVTNVALPLPRFARWLPCCCGVSTRPRSRSSGQSSPPNSRLALRSSTWWASRTRLTRASVRRCASVRRSSRATCSVGGRSIAANCSGKTGVAPDSKKYLYYKKKYSQVKLHNNSDCTICNLVFFKLLPWTPGSPYH